MADVGADLLPTLVAATVAMGIGGLVGGVARHLVVAPSVACPA